MLLRTKFQISFNIFPYTQSVKIRGKLSLRVDNLMAKAFQETRVLISKIKSHYSIYECLSFVFCMFHSLY